MDLWEEGEEQSYIDDIKSPEQKEIQKTKWMLAENLAQKDKDQFKDLCTSKFYLKLAYKEVIFHTPESSELEFLKDYFAPFTVNKVSDPFEIYYLPFENEYKESSHKLWWEKTYFTRTKKIDENSFMAIQRNFVALLQDQAKQCFIQGPKIDENIINTIDNSFLTCLGPNLIDVNSLALHCATVIYNKKAYIFYGPSGAGKSTLAEFCMDKYDMQIMSGDQVYIHLEGGKIMACPCMSTIPGIDRKGSYWAKKPTPVAAITYLDRGENNFHYSEQNASEMIKTFLREIVYLADFRDSTKLLDLSLKFLAQKDVKYGKMYYQKDYAFWDDFLEALI